MDDQFRDLVCHIKMELRGGICMNHSQTMPVCNYVCITYMGCDQSKWDGVREPWNWRCQA